MQEMMDEKEGLCLSNDQVHMMCGIGTKLQEMMAATMEDMQDSSMTHDMKLLSSGRAFTFDEPSEEKEVQEGQETFQEDQGTFQEEQETFQEEQGTFQEEQETFQD